MWGSGPLQPQHLWLHCQVGPGPTSFSVLLLLGRQGSSSSKRSPGAWVCTFLGKKNRLNTSQILSYTSNPAHANEQLVKQGCQNDLLNYKGFPPSSFPSFAGISQKNVICAVFPFQLRHSDREEEETSGSCTAREDSEMASLVFCGVITVNKTSCVL